MTSYLAKYGQQVADNGYRIIPIRPGHKAPLGLDWSQRSGGPAEVTEWLARGFTHEHWSDRKAKVRGTRTWRVDDYGVGVLTAETPLVDIDCQDESVAAHMRAFTEQLLGPTLCRIGLAPKAGLVYRAEKPFGKVNSATFLDDKGRRAKLEVLGAGQQFVALAIHPDTKEPYRWTGKKGVHNTPAASLPTINVDQARAIKEEFERVAANHKWDVVEESRSLTGGKRDTTDPFADVADKVTGISDAEFKRLLMLVPGADEYHSWIEIGMAIFHQTSGSDLGLELWDSWSELSPKYDRDSLELHWSSFDIDGKGRAPLTARVILERAWAIEKEQAEKQTDQAIEDFRLAKTPASLQEAARKYKSIAFPLAERARLVAELRSAYKQLTNQVLSADLAKKMLAYEDSQRADRFDWCADWVFVQTDEMFDNLKTGQSLTGRAFDGTFSRALLSRVDILEGKTVPDSLPQHVARNVVQVPIAADRMYMPGFDPLFTLNGQDYVNSYTDRGVPTVPSKMSVEGRRAIDIVERHAEHIIANERDRTIFLDALAYVVQSQQRVSWGIFLQGVGGDGKTFFGNLMAAVIGMENAPIIRGAELKEKYTGWAEGGMFLTVEEVRLQGEHRYDAVNNIKPYITNSRVPIRRMQRDIYTIVNRTTYFLTSNYKDGLPEDDTERFMVLYSRWQSLERLKAFKAANPTYYRDLFEALNEAGSLRKWLLERRLSSAFDPDGRAPDSSSKGEMQEITGRPERVDLKRLLAESTDADFGLLLLDSALLEDRLDLPLQGKQVSAALTSIGMTWVGETGFGGKTRRWWSIEPERFRMTTPDGMTKIDPNVIRNWLENAL